MFGFSFGELVVLLIVGVVVLGPKELPAMLRKAGQWSAKLRRMASDLRTQSGIDEVLRSDGIGENIAEIRKLARGELDHITRAASVNLHAPSPALGIGARPAAGLGGSALAAHDPYADGDVTPIVREREYPREGADSYGALSDSTIVYADTLPPSPLATDALYLTGERALEPSKSEPVAEVAQQASGEP